MNCVPYNSLFIQPTLRWITTMKKTIFFVLLVLVIFVLLLQTTILYKPCVIPTEKVSRNAYSANVHEDVLEGTYSTTGGITPSLDIGTETEMAFEKDTLHTSDISKERRENDVNKDKHEIAREVSHIVFLKVHKAASSTVQAIIQRFGLRRNLSIIIADSSHYISQQKHFFSDLWPPLPKISDAGKNAIDLNEQNKHDILCNHMVFNTKKVSKHVYSDSKYIAIVRDPFEQFLSAAFYYKFVWKYPYLERLSNETFITDLIRNPTQNEATTTAESKTYNSMAYDFGLEFTTLKEAENISEAKFNEFLNRTGDIFHLVMIVEKFDQSLVLLKRYLNWSLEDILYVKTNIYLSGLKTKTIKGLNITANDTNILRERNKFDYALYDFFKNRLENQISEEANFKEEVEHFKGLLLDVQEFCVEDEIEKENMAVQTTKEFVNFNASNKDSHKNDTSDQKLGKKETEQELLQVINSIIQKKKMTKEQESEIRWLVNFRDKGINKWTVEKFTRLLPLLFYDKDTSVGRQAGLTFSKSQWNKEFYMSETDCDLLTWDELTRYAFVKEKHLKNLVHKQFGDNFSVKEALKYVFTFY